MREPLAGELGTLKYDWARVVEGGFVCASVLDGAAWIHELRYSGRDSGMALKMMREAVRWCKAQGYESVLVNVSNSKLRRLLERRDFKVTQVIMKGAI